MPKEMAKDDPVSVAIVDDSRSVRRWLRAVLNADDRLEVVAEAGSGLEARDLLLKTKVDVMTLDINMPGMTGIEFLEKLMIHRPMPVVMLSALTEEGSREAVEALSLGAVDCIEKPRAAVEGELLKEMRDRIWQAAQSHVSPQQHRQIHKTSRRTRPEPVPWNGPVILLGASTGGVAALESVLVELEGNPAPVIIAQHMPENFLRSFGRRLNELFSRRCKMADEGMLLQENHAILCTGRTFSTRLARKSNGDPYCTFGLPSESAKYHPNIDDMLLSAAGIGMCGCAAVLTGMGTDGANGLLACRQAGFETWAQDEQTSVVYGMPKAAAELSAADQIAAPSEIGASINRTIMQLLNTGSAK